MKSEEFVTTANEKKENERSITLKTQVPETLAEAVDVYGEKVVFSIFMQQKRVKEQGYIRSLLSATVKDSDELVNNDESVAEKFASWKLTGGNRQAKTKQEKMAELMAGMSAEERADAIREAEALLASLVDDAEDEGGIESEDFEDYEEL